MNETTIDLIRHGEPVGGQRLRGTQDDPLSDLGWEQMRSAIGEHAPWSLVRSSPLKRCRHFADELATRLDVELEIMDGFREIGFGVWEGRTTAELMKHEPDALRAYWADPVNCTPPGGERLDQFIQRVHKAWETLIKESMNQHSILVCHGGVIRAILVHVLGMAHDKLWNIDVPYANVSRIVVHQFGENDRAAQLKFHQSRLI